MSSKVSERIGKAFVKLMADKIVEIEENQQKIIKDLTRLLGENFGDLLATDPEKARGFIHELSYAVDIYRDISCRFKDFKNILSRIVEKFAEEGE